MNDTLQIATFVVIVLLVAAWYLSYSAARLDRLHAKVEGAMSALDAQLIRRAEAALELANSGVLDPASALLIADAATESLERTTEQPVTDDHRHRPASSAAWPRCSRAASSWTSSPPSRPRSPRTPAPWPSWRSSGCPPTSGPRAASRG
jgi:hypothetical protein